MSETELLHAAWDEPVHWTHPVLPNGKIGPARGVLTRIQPIRKPLREFTLFPKLPFDIRICIWRMATPFNRIIHIHEEIEFPDPSWDVDSEVDEEEAEREGEDGEDHYSTAAINKLVDDRGISNMLRALDYPRNGTGQGFFSNYGQGQLEDYGFTSSKEKPKLPTDHQQLKAAQVTWEKTRMSAFCSISSPIPVVLHVCRESRHLLQSYGYEITFSTRTDPGEIWFNYSSDILYLRESFEVEYASPNLDGGMWNIGQFRRQDLDRVRMLALSLGDYSYGGKIPTSLHKAVQLCGNLKELLIVETDSHDSYDSSRDVYDWNDSRATVGTDFVDMSVEELWGHHMGWQSRSHSYGDWGYRDISRDLDRRDVSIDGLAKDIEEQLRNQRSLSPDEKEWAIPKVRFVLVMSRYEASKVMESREKYRRYIDNMYWNKVAGARKSYRPPSPLQLRDGEEAENEYRRNECYCCNSTPALDFSWYEQAREAINSVRGWPSPFTMEWIEASEARLDMDSWPWAEE